MEKTTQYLVDLGYDSDIGYVYDLRTEDLTDPDNSLLEVAVFYSHRDGEEVLVCARENITDEVKKLEGRECLGNAVFTDPDARMHNIDLDVYGTPRDLAIGDWIDVSEDERYLITGMFTRFDCGLMMITF